MFQHLDTHNVKTQQNKTTVSTPAASCCCWILILISVQLHMPTHPAINMHQVMLLSALLCPSVCHFLLTFTADGTCGNYFCAHLFVGIFFVFSQLSVL